MSRRSFPKNCACERCRTVVQPGELMCRAHWLSLPAALRKSILFTRQQRWDRDYAAYVREAIDMIAAREGAFTDIFENSAVRMTAAEKAGDGSATPSPANFVVPQFGGVAI